MVFIQQEQVLPRHQSTRLCDVIEIKTEASVTIDWDKFLTLALAFGNTTICQVMWCHDITKRPWYEVI